MKTTNVSGNFPVVIPPAFASPEALSTAYRHGWNHGHGFACNNVPTLGDSQWTDDIGRVTVDEDNIRDVHQSLCYAAAENSRQYSPFEFTAAAFNRAEGGWTVRDSADDSWSLGPFDTEAEAHQAMTAEGTRLALADGVTEAEALTRLSVVDNPSSEELWEAFEAGQADSIEADLATYTDEDYGIGTKDLAEAAAEPRLRLGTLHDYATGEALRPATEAELRASIEAARNDGGRGVISADGRSCYVEGEGQAE